MFNLRGRKKVASLSGTIVSIIMTFILIMYSAVKFIQLNERSNPNISSYIEEGAIQGKNEGINFADVDFKFAFSVEGYIDKEAKFDSRYVKGIARMFDRNDEKVSEILLQYHECSLQELYQFPSPAPDSVGLMEYYKKGGNKLFCVDQERYRDTLEIWGTE